MNRYPWVLDDRSWTDRLNPLVVRLARPIRRWMQIRRQRLLEIDVLGTEHLAPLLGESAGVLIVPNHSTHADAFVMYELADRLGRCFHFMATTQMFAAVGPLVRWLYTRHGCFSVDREGTDLRAFKRAVKILQESPHPLVIFPEGEVYHLNDRVTPFRDGPATIALTARRRAKRPVYCIPCALKYHYVRDPTPELEALMTELERKIAWRPRTGRPLVERVLKYAEGQLALKEVYYLDGPQPGTLRERLTRLHGSILERLEDHYGKSGRGKTVPERVKEVRRACLARFEDTDQSTGAQSEVEPHLDDLFVAVQLFSYPGDYLLENPPVERVAETLDKLEEDILERQTARIRGARRAVVVLGAPLDVADFAQGSPRKSAPKLTDELERRVQALIDTLRQ